MGVDGGEPYENQEEQRAMEAGHGEGRPAGHGPRVAERSFVRCLSGIAVWPHQQGPVVSSHVLARSHQVTPRTGDSRLLLGKRPHRWVGVEQTARDWGRDSTSALHLARAQNSALSAPDFLSVHTSFEVSSLRGLHFFLRPRPRRSRGRPPPDVARPWPSHRTRGRALEEG